MSWVRRLLSIGCWAVRVLVVTVLLVLAPIVRFVLGGVALVGLLVAVFFKLAGASGGSHLRWSLIAVVSIGFGVVAIGYEALCGFLIGRSRR